MANTDGKLADDARAKFLEVLEKKRKKNGSGSRGGPSSVSKVGDVQASGGATKRFQRKSGSA